MLGVHQWKPRQPGQKGLRILSLDGGGTRGVMTIALLREVLKGVDKDVHEVNFLLEGKHHWQLYYTVVVMLYRRCGINSNQKRPNACLSVGQQNVHIHSHAFENTQAHTHKNTGTTHYQVCEIL